MPLNPVGGSLELRGAAEVELWATLLVLPVGDDAPVADVDVHAVVGADAVDGLYLGAPLRVGQLVVGTAIQDGAFQQWPLEGAARDGDDGAAPVLGLAAVVGLAQRHFQLQGELQVGAFGGLSLLCLGTEGQHRHEGDKKECFSHV